MEDYNNKDSNRNIVLILAGAYVFKFLFVEGLATAVFADFTGVKANLLFYAFAYYIFPVASVLFILSKKVGWMMMSVYLLFAVFHRFYFLFTHQINFTSYYQAGMIVTAGYFQYLLLKPERLKFFSTSQADIAISCAVAVSGILAVHS